MMVRPGPLERGGSPAHRRRRGPQGEPPAWGVPNKARARPHQLIHAAIQRWVAVGAIVVSRAITITTIHSINSEEP